MHQVWAFLKNKFGDVEEEAIIGKVSGIHSGQWGLVSTDEHQATMGNAKWMSEWFGSPKMFKTCHSGDREDAGFMGVLKFVQCGAPPLKKRMQKYLAF